MFGSWFIKLKNRMCLLCFLFDSKSMPYPWISLSLGIRRGSNEGFACGFVFFKLNDKPFVKYSINIHLCHDDSKYLSRCWSSPDILGQFLEHCSEIVFTLQLFSWTNSLCSHFVQLSEPWPRLTTANVLFLQQQQILSLACYNCLLNTKEWSSEWSNFCLNDIQRL